MDQIIVKFLTNESSPEENEILLRWIEDSPQNKKYFINIQQLFVAAKVNKKATRKEKFEAEKIWNDILFKETSKNLKSIRRKRIFFAILSSAAASVLILLGIGLHNFYKEQASPDIAENTPIKVVPPSAPTLVLSDGREVSLSDRKSDINDAGVSIKNNESNGLAYTGTAKNAEIKFNTIKIPTATIFQLTLCDGTKVWLNSESELRYPVSFSKSERKVYLKGEAYFEVSKQKNKAPFIVESGKFSTQVLGTHFNVSCYPEDINQHVTLSEGSVRVGINNAQVQLNVGDQMRYNQTNQTVTKQQVDVNEYDSWIDGQTCFTNTPLNELALMIKRFYGISVVLSDESLSTLRFSGKLLRSYDPRKIIKLISESAELKWEVQDNTIILLKKQ